ncbi:MAG: hypothetical protein JWQ42_4239 [Edaphobacter sp.]|nr:hypothetical protein [Edaphobacter sp.]
MKSDMDTALSSKECLFSVAPTGFAVKGLPEFSTEMPSPSAGRYWRTLKHLRASQIYYLLRHRVLIQKDILRWPEATVAIRHWDGLPRIQEWQPELARQIIEAGHVQFLRTPLLDGETTSWIAQEISRRQIYHANYCDFLNVDLSSPGDSELLQRATKIALSWCDQNPSGKEMGWHPFFVSLRVVNWLKYLVRNASRAEELGDAEGVQRILESLRIQVLSLESRLERELLANHLLKNAKALVFAGALLDAPESGRWRALGQRLLLEQMVQQILPDGGHIERSPMYHAWVLDHLLDIQNLFRSCPAELPGCAEELSNSIDHMADYLSHIIHPDGEIPLLNDSQFGVTRPTSMILKDAGLSGRYDLGSGTSVQVFPDSGYASIRDFDSESFLIFDCGQLGPDYQPGHGHADVLSFELTLGRQRVIVDTGVSSYEPSSERHYERSTAAHNTIRIDGIEQAEIWGSFRVGRRPSVSPIRSRKFAGSQFVQGAHYGYKHLGVVHSRAIVHLATNAWVIVDQISGRGRHKVESFLHFHPDVDVRPIIEPNVAHTDVVVPRWSIDVKGKLYTLMTMGAVTARHVDAWYSPGFAIRLPQSVIHWLWEGELPATMLYAIVPAWAPPVSIGRAAYAAGGIEIDGLFIPL